MKFWFLNNPNRRWIPRRTWRKVKESREIRPWHATWQRYGTWPRHAGTWSREGEILKYHNQLQLFHIDCIVICIILSRFSKFIHCVQNSNKAFKFEFAIYLGVDGSEKTHLPKKICFWNVFWAILSHFDKGCGSKFVDLQILAILWKYTNLLPHPLNIYTIHAFSLYHINFKK